MMSARVRARPGGIVRHDLGADVAILRGAASRSEAVAAAVSAGPDRDHLRALVASACAVLALRDAVARGDLDAAGAGRVRHCVYMFGGIVRCV